MSSALSRQMCIAVFVLCGVMAGASHASEPALSRQAPNAMLIDSLAALKNLTAAELEQLYANGSAETQPIGFTRGEVLYLANTSLPRVKARLTGLIWKGKHFTGDGDFINQWSCFRAVHSKGYIGASYFDGLPSMVLEYPEKTPYFGNMRDEVRQIAPGLYLCMVFDRTGAHTFRGFIGLEVETPRAAGGSEAETPRRPVADRW